MPCTVTYQTPPPATMPSPKAFARQKGYIVEGKVSSFFKACGRIAYLQRHPEATRPGELDALAEQLLAHGTGRNRNWLTARQMRRRSERELQIGPHIERATKEPGQWLATMPDKKTKRGAK